MFAQVIHGRTSDAPALQAAMDRWVADLAPGAIGWLGSTGGITDDGQFVEIARFESAEAAGRNSQRPEQTRWWEQTRQHFEGEVSFLDSEDVTVDLQGDPGQAGFVQVMRGQVSDPDRAKELMTQVPAEAMAAFRPDVLGSVSIGHDDGEWTQVVYFTSEAEARAGEGRQPPPELQAAMEEMGRLNLRAPDFVDLHRPRLHSP